MPHVPLGRAANSDDFLPLHRIRDHLPLEWWRAAAVVSRTTWPKELVSPRAVLKKFDAKRRTFETALQ